MNIFLSYCGLFDARISASEKDLPVQVIFYEFDALFLQLNQNVMSLFASVVSCCQTVLGALLHTAGLDTTFIQIYMDAPPGVSRVSKKPEGHKNQYLDVFLR